MRCPNCNAALEEEARLDSSCDNDSAWERVSGRCPVCKQSYFWDRYYTIFLAEECNLEKDEV